MDEKPPYAILRIGKIKSFETLAAVEYHNTRQIPAGTVTGAPQPEDLVKLTGSYRDRVEQVFHETGASWEKGKVLAVEMLVTASPEWWTTAAPEEREQWWQAQWRFANDKFGPGLIAFTPHLDESTPHCHFVGLPIYHAIEKKRGNKPRKPEAIRKREAEEAAAPKIWRLSYDALFGGKSERLAGLQTEYHGYVKHLGLARGRDTVGLQIKHQTLKHYKQLLLQMERDLDREAAELRETREVLDHYNERLADGFAELNSDKLALFAQQEQARVRDEALATREHAISRRETELRTRGEAIDRREFDLARRTADLNRREKSHEAALARIGSEQAALALAQASLGDQRNALRERAEAVERRDGQLAAREGSVTQREKAHQDIEHQLSIVGGLFTGRLRGHWDGAKQQPQIDEGKMSLDERGAAASPWPMWIAAAARQALRMADVRRALAQKVAKMLATLRKKQLVARSAAQQAQAEARAAQSRATVATAEADAAKARCEEHQRTERTAIETISSATSQLTTIEAETAAVIRLRDAVLSDLGNLQREKVQVKQDVATLKAEVAMKTRAKEAVQADLHRIEAERAALKAEVRVLNLDRAAFAREQVKFDEDKEELKWERARQELSRRLASELFAGSTIIDLEKTGLRVRRQGDKPRHLENGTFEPWLLTLIRKHRAIEIALGQVDVVRAELAVSRRAQADRQPDERSRLEREQALEDAMIARKLPQLGPPPTGFER
ncbi:plasmid recombination protein [Qipengyuania sediminis]|uniref:plasmid recombination protein n=1 Tax=Qipengyuania sediminis TaxID=1532023 RepID=UPI0010596542|nr:plasmid recombination protein [Qipengyuania sediminis]